MVLFSITWPTEEVSRSSNGAVDSMVTSSVISPTFELEILSLYLIDRQRQAVKSV